MRGVIQLISLDAEGSTKMVTGDVGKNEDEYDDDDEVVNVDDNDDDIDEVQEEDDDEDDDDDDNDDDEEEDTKRQKQKKQSKKSTSGLPATLWHSLDHATEVRSRLERTQRGGEVGQVRIVEGCFDRGRVETGCVCEKVGGK